MAYTVHRQLTGNAVEHVPRALLRNRTACNSVFGSLAVMLEGAASACRKADRLFPPAPADATLGHRAAHVRANSSLHGWNQPGRHPSQRVRYGFPFRLARLPPLQPRLGSR